VRLTRTRPLSYYVRQCLDDALARTTPRGTVSYARLLPNDALERSDLCASALRELGLKLHEGGVFVLSGAGVSTDSGIPDYRDDDGAWKARAPVQYRDFVNSEAVRRRYWARSMLGFPTISETQPNPAHQALRLLEERRQCSLLVTQNVDGLHSRAGSQRVIDLHGRLDRVKCLGCGAITERGALQSELVARNPQFVGAVGTPKPDGDAELAAVNYQDFQLVECAGCGGMLKPDLVFFGENVPAERVHEAMTALERSRLLLVVGTSLMVFSGYRFARAAARLGVPIAVVNRGKTRADELAQLKISGNAAEILTKLLVLRP